MWSDWLTPVRLVYRSVFLALLILILTPLTVICQGRFGASISVGGRKLDEFMLNFWATMTCRTFGLRVKPCGTVLSGPVVIVANHVSWLDIQVLHSQASMSFVAKAEIGDWPLVGFLATRGGTVYHHRGSHDSSSDVTSQMLAKLAAGGRVAIFPEGGIFPGVDIKHFHARMFRLAIEADCPVQPAMIRYREGDRRDDRMTFIGDESFGTNLLRLMGRPAREVELKFFEPFAAGDRQRKDLAEQAETLVRTHYNEPLDGTGKPS